MKSNGPFYGLSAEQVGFRCASLLRADEGKYR